MLVLFHSVFVVVAGSNESKIFTYVDLALTLLALVACVAASNVIDSRLSRFEEEQKPYLGLEFSVSFFFLSDGECF